MTRPAHTEWFQEGPTYYEYDNAALCLLNAGYRVSIQLVGSVTHKVTTEEVQAVADLIKAAPELLEVLELILADEEVALSRPDYERAHEAIAKAGGQS